MSKRIQLMQKMRSYHYDTLKKLPFYHPSFKRITKTVQNLDKRINKYYRKKHDADQAQMSAFDIFKLEYKKPEWKRKTVVCYVTATTEANAKKLVRKKQGSKIKFLTIK